MALNQRLKTGRRFAAVLAAATTIAAMVTATMTAVTTTGARADTPSPDHLVIAAVWGANYEAQLAASRLAMPKRPGATQPTPHQDPVTTAPDQTTTSGGATSAATTTTTAPYEPAAAVSKVRVTGVVPVGRRAVVTIAGAKSGSAVVVRNARGKVVARGHAHAGGHLEVRLPTDRMTPGKHGFTVMYVAVDGLHHTKNIKVHVARRHR